LAALVQRWPWRRWLLSVGVLLLLAVPMYLGFALTHGDPFLPSTHGATVNRNLEFPERHGTPGFPTREEYEQSWEAGPRISAAKYFLGYHTLPQIIWYSVRGAVVIFRDMLYRDDTWSLLIFVAGLVLLLRRRQWLIPLLLCAVMAPPYSFLAGAPNNLFVERYSLHALPLAEIVFAYGAVSAAMGFSRLLAVWRASRRPELWSRQRVPWQAPAVSTTK
ncbi:MAG TPA: hypothetical protein VGW38_02185, partial [Chloroflexota bacterium]|nr:hypothetical protein [Chloroflexota bacterium]